MCVNRPPHFFRRWKTRSPRVGFITGFGNAAAGTLGISPNPERYGLKLTTSMQTPFGEDSARAQQRGGGQVPRNMNGPAPVLYGSTNLVCHTQPGVEDMPTRSRGDGTQDLLYGPQ